jgi:hypothetical protein
MSVLNVRTPEDVLAVVPQVLGFHPAESVVMLTFGGAVGFHARVDHPDSADGIDPCLAALIKPCRLHEVPRVLLVLYTADEPMARTVCQHALINYPAAGIEVVEVLHAHDGTFASFLHGDGERRPYDTTGHPLTAHCAVEHGNAPVGSRADLARALQRVDHAVAADQVWRWVDDRRVGEDEVQRMADLVVIHALGKVPLDDDTLARLLADLQHGELRDAAWLGMTRESARDLTEFWSEVVRRSPTEFVTPAALILGLAAWLAGQGALAWTAHDLATDDRYQSLADIVGQLLDDAVPPDAWPEFQRHLRSGVE